MKWFAHISAVLLLGFLAAAFPHDGSRALGKRDVGQNEAKPIEEIVYVNKAGHTLSVEHLNHATATVNNPPTDLPPILPVPNLVAPDVLVPTLPTIVADSPYPPHTAIQNNKWKRGHGISYSPYNADNTCRTQEQIHSDIDKMAAYAYVRIYGVDCDQTRRVVNAARPRGMKVFAGIWDLQSLDASIDLIAQAAAGDWSVFHTISVGNELINRGAASVNDVVSAVSNARNRLRRAGYTGPVVTIDTFSQMLKYPELCDISDYCAANCHAFFDATQTPGKAGQYAREQFRKLSEAHRGKRTTIAESGWPHNGRPNGAAVPSPANQRIAIESLRRAFNGDPDNLILFSAFDDLWKTDWEGSFGAEKYWGIGQR